MRALLLAVLVLPLAGALAAPPCDSAVAACVPFERLEQGLHSGAWGYHVIETETEWRAFWALHAADRPAPEVDLSTHWVAAIIFHRLTCCPGIVIERVSHEEGIYAVSYRHVPTGVLQAYSEPFDIVAVERVHEGEAVAVFVGPPPTSTPRDTPVVGVIGIP